MMSKVVQFRELEDFIAEFNAGHLIRVQPLQRTEGSMGNGTVRLVVFGVAARAFHDDEVLAWYWPVKKMQIWPSDHNRDEVEAAWEQCTGAAADVVNHLEASGLDVRPGVIHVDPETIMYGEWEEYEDGGKS